MVGEGIAYELVMLTSRSFCSLNLPPPPSFPPTVPPSLHLSQVSKISLVDLAGSERAKDTGAEGKRLQVHLS